MTVLICVAGFGGGCATAMLLSATDPDDQTWRSAHWEMRDIEMAYIGPERDLLVCITARAPRTARDRRYSLQIPLVPLVAAIQEGSIASHTPLHGSPQDVLITPSNSRFMTNYPSVRNMGLHQRPGPSTDIPLAVRWIYTGWPDRDRLPSDGWTPIPIRALASPRRTVNSWHELKSLPHTQQPTGELLYPLTTDNPKAFAYASPAEIMGGNHSLAFHLADVRYATQNPVWPRIFLPLTLAFDVVTSPVQALVIIYFVSTFSWP